MDDSYPKERGGGGRVRSRPSGNASNDIIQTALSKTARRTSSTPPLFRTITWILIVLCTSFLAFYIGVWTGIQAGSSAEGGAAAAAAACRPCARCKPCPSPTALKGTSGLPNISDEALHQKVEALAKQQVKDHLEDLCKALPSAASHDVPKTPTKKKGESLLFSRSIEHFARGMVRVAKDDLMKTFDFGVPPNANTENMDALILYNKKESLPSDEHVAKAARYEDPTKPLPILSAKTATENCDTMNVVMIDIPGNTHQCFALVGGQYQSYHVHRWMRRKEKYGALDHEQPLRLTSRGWTAAGRQEFISPKEKQSKQHQEKLLTYLTEVDGIRSRLKKILEKMNTKTVVVLTCNHGQSELLMNFACSARARGFDLTNVLVFPTDLETKELSEGVGLATFYEEKMMASIPKKEAAVYGDTIFTSVMFAKVLCVQLVNELGYDLLFQDADVVWYKNPLDYFHDKSLPEFDIYFQDDGSRQERYAPYSANTGFYFVRSNDKTKTLFRHFIYTSDLITAWNSHQQVLIAMLAEHSSLYGLTVKIFAKETEEFPGGLHYHRKTEPMKKIFSGDSNAFIFHMSWTNNKDNKLKFFQQMGDWYLKDHCIEKEAHQITDEKGSHTDGVLAKHCCSAAPLIKCHYKDKPSKIPCPDAPCIDKKCQSFW